MMWIVRRMLPFRPMFPRLGVISYFFNGFCNKVDSLNLPDMIEYLNSDQICGVNSDDDDFVLPIKLESLEDLNGSRKSNNLFGNFSLMRDEISVEHAVVEQISSILSNRFLSPEAVEVALHGLNLEVSGDAVDTLLRRFSNDWVAAFGFFKWATSQPGFVHCSDSYDAMVDILGKSKQFDAMWELVESMVKFGGLVSLNTLCKVMRRLAGAGRWGDSIRAFRDMERFGIKQDTLSMNILLDTLCKERSVKHAWEIFVELRSRISPDSSSFNSLIHGWCQARKVKEAQKTLEEMRDFGFEPCVISYTSLIEAYCREKDFHKVDEILVEMREKGCKPNIVTYTIIMHSLGKAKETQEAFRILERMKMDGCIPDTAFYNSLIYIVSREGRLRDANAIYEEMCSMGASPNVTTYNTMISAACDHSQEDIALNLLLRMQASSCKPDIKTYSPLLKLCCKRGWMKILLYLLADMLKKDVSIDFGTYTLLVHSLCKNRKLDYSCLFFEEMVLKGFTPKQHTFSMLLEALEEKSMVIAKEKLQKLMSMRKDMKQPKTF